MDCQGCSLYSTFAQAAGKKWYIMLVNPYVAKHQSLYTGKLHHKYFNTCIYFQIVFSYPYGEGCDYQMKMDVDIEAWKKGITPESWNNINSKLYKTPQEMANEFKKQIIYIIKFFDANHNTISLDDGPYGHPEIIINLKNKNSQLESSIVFNHFGILKESVLIPLGGGNEEDVFATGAGGGNFLLINGNYTYITRSRM